MAEQHHVEDVEATFEAPVNIALIKYWGKRDVALNLPLNGSLSITISCDALRTVTTVRASPRYERDTLVLNGREDDLSGGKGAHVLRCLDEVRALSSAPWRGWRVRVASRNTFPTAAGLASSASGFACLVAAAAHVFRVADAAALSRVARVGSGSACRSLFGGFVLWDAGECADGADSVARQLFPASHWPEMRVLLLVADAREKALGSTDGMQRTARTSELMRERLRLVPGRLDALREAIARRDFAAVAEAAMRDSNTFHAVCLDSYPPISYLSATSRAVIRLVHAINDASGRIVVGYTFDAGPNPVLIMLEQDVTRVMELLLYHFPPLALCAECFGGDAVKFLAPALNTRDGLEVMQAPDEAVARAMGNERTANALSRFMLARVGNGPAALSPVESLLR